MVRVQRCVPEVFKKSKFQKLAQFLNIKMREGDLYKKMKRRNELQIK